MFHKNSTFFDIFVQKITPASAEVIDKSILNHIIIYPLFTLYVIDFNAFQFTQIIFKVHMYQVIHGFFFVICWFGVFLIKNALSQRLKALVFVVAGVRLELTTFGL